MNEAGKTGGEIPSLKELYGNKLELTGEDGASVAWTLLAQLDVGGRSYAVIQSEQMRKDGDIEILRIALDEDNAPQLESVEDDEEWESVSEAYDDLQFEGEERP
ncbi:DUF1292 domain-containing protein [Cohnella fermenti]|uniref:DUF1292 domain-containing protein n=1 Tax=Cohnella fermenti TaxID=2565925 RepID=A0A4S4BXP0_9BACL|nr:DUF1292 domain-containing protein [Cohnella fermenti]THF79953.1 DUF1292 domain-containing protein [Cohnella fermenti]